jgi:bifunctional polynucleotide phosphatase/kinase
MLTLSTDKATSYYVGDAAGRPGDHAATDRKWALNVGIPFFTPEVVTVDLRASFLLSWMSTGIFPQPARTPVFSATGIPPIISSQLFVAFFGCHLRYILTSVFNDLSAFDYSNIFPYIASSV